MSDPKSDQKAEPKKLRQIIEAGLAPHMAAALPMLQSQNVIRVGTPAGPRGVATRGVQALSIRSTQRGLEVVLPGKGPIIIGSGSWTYFIEADVEEPAEAKP